VPAIIASQRCFNDCYTPAQCQLQKWVHRLADYVLVNSEKIAEELQQSRTVQSEQIVYIPNGLDLERFTPKPRHDRSSRPFTVGTLANLRPEKGLAHFIHAAAVVHKRFPKICFALWGQGLLREELEGLVHELGLHGTVEFRGQTAAPEVALRQLDIFVLPSLSEACSNALLEAMATGLPVVATRVGGNTALVKDLITGLLVPPSNPDALAKAIIKLVEEPLLATELAIRGQNQVRTEFGMDRMLTRIETLYQRALIRCDN
jgi:glycosyltransferase involved in cell wall biosynthesis